MTARALTEEEPRTAADLAADALDVCEKVGHIVTRPRFSASADAPASILERDAEDLRWQVQRLARQLAEVAQLVDDPTVMLPEERADAEAEQQAIEDEGPTDGEALDQIAAVLLAADWSGVMYDDDALQQIHEWVTAANRDAGPEDGTS